MTCGINHLHSSRSMVITINHILHSPWPLVKTINHLLHSSLPVFWTIRHVRSLIILAINCAMSGVQPSLAMSGLNSSCPPQRILMYVLPENYILLGFYAASSGNFLPTFWDILSVPSSRAKNPKIRNKPGMSQRNYHCLLRNNPEEQFSSTSRRKSETTHMLSPPPLFPNKNATCVSTTPLQDVV
jgi:hypothetical protein